MKKTYKIDVDCANCAREMAEASLKVAGVVSCDVSYMTLKMNIELKDGVDEKATMQAVRKACKRVEPDSEVYL